MDWLTQLFEDPQTETLLSSLLGQASGDPSQASMLAMQQRTDPAMEMDPTLANAEHALFSQSLVNQNPAWMAALPLLVPGYQAAKWTAQNIPGVGNVADRLSPIPLKKATPPSLTQMLYGLRPLWGK